MSKSNKKTLVLLDVHAIIHRAYHALPDFASSKGEPTGALYGLCLMLFKLIEDFKPDYIAACFDLPKPTYRHLAYDAYKAGRKKTDDALVSQIIRSREVFRAFSIPEYDKEGFEADDMLGTIVEQMKDEKGIEIVIASGDMDTMQLIEGERVRVFTLKKGVKDTVTYGEKEVVERFGFKPLQLTDYKGLRGDTSDNIIGIKGIGEKTATTLIQEFGTIEKMYEKIEAGKKEEFKKIGVTERIYELLANNKDEAVFSKMLATIRRDAPIDFKLPETTWREHIVIDNVKNMLKSFDFRSMVPRVDVVFGNGNSEVGESEEDNSKKEIKTITHNLSEEEIEKLKIATFVLNSTISNPELSDVLAYSEHEDADEAKKNILNEIKKKGLEFVYEKIELPLIPIIKKMHDIGVAIDADYLKKLAKDYHKELDKIDKKIFEHAGHEFNVDSPKQLGVVLYDELNLVGKNMKKTAGGAKSTKESELEKLKDLHPIISLIMEHRELAKLLGTYIDVIPTLLDEEGRLHPTFIQTGAATGRMASKDPGVQNIPIKTELGRAIRNAFIAKKGFKLCAFDYSQIELRIAAILSDDQKLQEIFKSGEDVHAGVASQVFGVLITEVTKDMRRKAKVINFGILYGMGVNALKTNLGSSREEAQRFYDDYFKTFSTLALYLEGVKADALKNGFVTTMYGRRRYFEGIKSHLPFIRAAAERMAINAPIQGTQADIVKLAMTEIDGIYGEDKDVRLLLQIHDELIYEIKESKVKEVSEKIKSVMENIMDSKMAKGVPIVANASCGDDWGNLK
ncbi:MAG: polA [Candidatus Taylorbacteria bacterium]|nr:polA [Candidatus Taylorbacteria bacterium]